LIFQYSSKRPDSSAKISRVLPPVSPAGFGCEDWPLGGGRPPTGVTRSLPPARKAPRALREGVGKRGLAPARLS